MRTLFDPRLIVALAAAAALPNLASAACVKPDPVVLTKGLEGALPVKPPKSVETLALAGAGEKLRWVTLSWAAPDGALFVVDCAGRRLAYRVIGSFDAIKPGPDIAGRPTLEGLLQPERKPGVHVQEVALFRYSGGKISLLWRHESQVVLSLPDAPKDETTTWRWRYEPDGRKIRVTGVRYTSKVFDPHTDSVKDLTRKLRPETWCWIPGRARIDRCQPVRPR